MFDHPPLLERFSVAHPAFPFAVYFPIGLYLAWRTWQHGLGLAAVVAAYTLGFSSGRFSNTGRTAARSITNRKQTVRWRTATSCTACITHIQTTRAAG